MWQCNHLIVTRTVTFISIILYPERIESGPFDDQTLRMTLHNIRGANARRRNGSVLFRSFRGDISRCWPHNTNRVPLRQLAIFDAEYPSEAALRPRPLTWQIGAQTINCKRLRNVKYSLSVLDGSLPSSLWYIRVQPRARSLHRHKDRTQ